MARQDKVRTQRERREVRSTHSKLDPRLKFLLSLSEKRRNELKAHEDAQLAKAAKELASAVRASDTAGAKEADNQLFAPLTAGLFVPEQCSRTREWLPAIKEPFVSAFILSDASSADLARLGALVRSRVGDVFSTFIPLHAISGLERSLAIRFVELARPLFPTLDYALPFTKMDGLHSAVPSIDGAGSIVGIYDDVLDLYHPDFRTSSNATRVLFLWDQTLTLQAGEMAPPTEPTLPGFTPNGGATYGVEYDRAAIDSELVSSNPPAVPAYSTVRHGGATDAHGTHVAGIATGNGRGQGGTYVGAAPAADIIFVACPNLFDTGLLADNTHMADAFSYIFARATQLGQPCVINMSTSDNQGPHDGTTLGERFLDDLLLTPSRAITLSAGNSNNTAAHAAGNIAAGATVDIQLNYQAGAAISDDVEIWYDGQDLFDVSVTLPTVPPTVIGPLQPGGQPANVTLQNGVQVEVRSDLNDPRNGNNRIGIIFMVPGGQSIPPGNTTIALTGTTVVNGAFQAWVDRNNRNRSAFLAPYVQADQLTLGVPSTGSRPITVGNHDTSLPPAIDPTSGHGPTRDGRIKPEIATIGFSVKAPRSRNMNAAMPGSLYVSKRGTSMSAPLVGGACALLFQCRGPSSTWANLKQILQDTAGTGGLVVPGNAFGFGYLQLDTACAPTAPNVDVWLRDDATDTGAEPFTGSVAWLSPDIEVLDSAGNPVPNPTFNPMQIYSNIIRVTIRNRGIHAASNTEVYIYWADPATNLPYPSSWNATGFFAGAPNFSAHENMIAIPTLAAGANTQVEFAWAPPAPGSNLRGDDHFCLLVRLENSGDPSRIGVGQWTSIVAHNNVALRNVHVQSNDAGDNVMSFYVIGSAEQDSLTVYPNLAGGSVELILPVQALPWRDIKLIERAGGPRLSFGDDRGSNDPLMSRKAVLKDDGIRTKTDITGAQHLALRNGTATVRIAEGSLLHVPYVRLGYGTRMIAKIHVSKAKIDEERRFVHVAQHSGGQLLGGVSLELR
jgi:hypothetical protein